MGITMVNMNEAKEMRENGCTYSDIGKHFGCSRQRAYDFLHSKKVTGKDNFNKIIYKNILSWCRDNGIFSIGKLANVLCLDISDTALANKLQGKNEFTLTEIKKIIKATGMDFDFCFSK